MRLWGRGFQPARGQRAYRVKGKTKVVKWPAGNRPHRRWPVAAHQRTWPDRRFSVCRGRMAPLAWRERFKLSLELRDAIDALLRLLGGVVGEAVLHEEGVLAAVLVEGAQHAHRPELLGSEEQLPPGSSPAHLQGDAGAAVAGLLADELGDHLGPDAAAAHAGVDREIQDVQFVLVQLVDHEPDHFFALLGHHADAVALAQATQKVLLRPGKVEAFGLRSAILLACPDGSSIGCGRGPVPSLSGSCSCALSSPPFPLERRAAPSVGTHLAPARLCGPRSEADRRRGVRKVVWRVASKDREGPPPAPVRRRRDISNGPPTAQEQDAAASNPPSHVFPGAKTRGGKRTWDLLRRLSRPSRPGRGARVTGSGFPLERPCSALAALVAGPTNAIRPFTFDDYRVQRQPDLSL